MPRYLFVISNSVPPGLGRHGETYDPFEALRYVGETLANAGYEARLKGHILSDGHDLTDSTWEFSSTSEIDAGTRKRLEGHQGVTVIDL